MDFAELTVPKVLSSRLAMLKYMTMEKSGLLHCGTFTGPSEEILRLEQNGKQQEMRF